MKDYFAVARLADHFVVFARTLSRRLWAKGIPAHKMGHPWRMAKKDSIWLRR